MRTKAQILKEIRELKSNPDSYYETTVRADPYSMIAREMLRKVPDSEVFEGMSFKEVRAYCKPVLMTALYNSKQKPIEAFGEDTEELHAFYTVMEELFPGSVAVQEALNESWNEKALFHEWTLPDGHVSHVKVVETVHGTLEAGGLEFGYTYHANQPSKVHTSLSPNFTHSYDGFIVRDMITNATFNIASIHDEFKCHPNYAMI